MRTGLVLALLIPVNVDAAPPAQPIIRDGTCPSGYYAGDEYCAPTSSAQFAIKRDGSCPSGYYASDKYYVAATDSAKAVIPRAGSCPSGWYASGNHCVSTR